MYHNIIPPLINKIINLNWAFHGLNNASLSDSIVNISRRAFQALLGILANIAIFNTGGTSLKSWIPILSYTASVNTFALLGIPNGWGSAKNK